MLNALIASPRKSVENTESQEPFASGLSQKPDCTVTGSRGPRVPGRRDDIAIAVEEKRSETISLRLPFGVLNMGIPCGF